MPARQNYIQCYCQECCELGGRDDADNPTGVPILSRNFQAHKMRVEADAVAHENVLVEEVGANLFSLTLSEDGPHEDVPGRLWASRADHEHATDSTPAPTWSTLTSMDDLMQSMSRIVLEPFHQPPPSEADRQSSKRQQSEHTAKAKGLLDSIQTEIQVIKQRLQQSQQSPSCPIVLQDMQTGVNCLRTATDSVNRRTGSIDELKGRTLEELDILETGVSHYAATIPEMAPHPVEHACGKS